MSATSLEFLIIGKDLASEAFEKVSKAVEKQKSAMDKLKVAGALATAALVTGVAKFSSDSVEAYAEAERKQALLQEAFKKFPALADTNIGKLNELNDAIQRKTGFDNDDLAASQATLAQFGLTGAQLEKLTPLVADFAAKTGKDLPTAAEAVGKALLGNAKVLKEVGISMPPVVNGAKVLASAQDRAAQAAANLAAKQRALSDMQEVQHSKHKLTVADHIALRNATDAVAQAQGKAKAAAEAVTAAQNGAGDTSSRLNTIMAGLKEKVGGVADAMGQTTTGKVQILRKSFEDFQEKIGSMLVPVLTKLVSIGQKVLDWMQKNPAIVQALAIAVGVLTIAIIAATAAMWAMSLTPIVLIIAAIVAAVALLIAGIILLVTHWKQVTAFITGLWNGFCAFIATTLKQMADKWNGTWDGLSKQIRTIWTGFTTWVTNLWHGFIAALNNGGNQIAHWWNGLWSGVSSFFIGVWNNITGWVSGVWGNITGAFQRGMQIIGAGWNALWNGLGGVVRGAMNGVIGFIQGALNNVIGLVNGAIAGINAVGGAVGIHVSAIPSVHIPAFANGTSSAPGGVALVGERGPELVNLPGGSRVTPNGGIIRLHPDDIDAIGDRIMAGIMFGSQKTVRAAFGR